MSKILSIVFFIQIAVIAFYSAKPVKTDGNITGINIEVEVPNLMNEEVVVETPALPESYKEASTVSNDKSKHKDDPYNFFIPERRVITEKNPLMLISLDKNVNVMAALGDALLNNPLIVRELESKVREMLTAFYGDFIKEADLSPAEQIELFKLLSYTMQENFRSFMSGIGQNMSEFRQAFIDGPPPEIVEALKQNNMQMKEEMIATLGNERFELFEKYHKEKSAAEELITLKKALERSDQSLNEEQEQSLRNVLLEKQTSPFEESSYIQNNDQPDVTEGILNKEQQKIYKRYRIRRGSLKRTMLMPF